MTAPKAIPRNRVLGRNFMFGVGTGGETGHMDERDIAPQSGSSDRSQAGKQPRSGRGADDRRTQVNPVDGPVPRSPEPEADAVREGEEKLRRVKPY